MTLPQLSIYSSTSTFPAYLECQARAAVRMLWDDPYVEDINAPFVPEERHPQYIVVAKEHVLISYARVIWVDVKHAGETFKVYALGDVFTYPAFRQRGYGRQVVDAATNLIRSDSLADAAILFTEPEHARFYGASGWDHVSLTNVTIGFDDEPVPHPYFSMMLFLSHRAQHARTAFETLPLHLPGFGW
ncbi:MAG: hypothetical protein OHK0046_17850 [Anaerolineae bacterium]